MDRAGNLVATSGPASADAVRRGQLTARIAGQNAQLSDSLGATVDRFGNPIAAPQMPRFFREGGEAIGDNTSLAEYLQQQGDSSIDTDPLGTAQQYLADVNAVKPMTAPIRRSVKRVSRGAGSDASTSKEMNLKLPALTASKQMTLNTASTPEEDQNKPKGTAREQMEDLVRSYELKIKAAKNKARGLAADVFGAPTLEGPSLTKNTLAKKRFAKGGEVKKLESSAELTAEDIEKASRPAFVTPKSGIGRKRSSKAGELEAAALQGVSETPYNLLGAPVDLVTMAMRPFGYDVQAPMLGSEDLKRRAAEAGIRQEPPKEGTAARALYNLAEVGSSAVNPAAPVRAGVKAAKAVGDKTADVAKDFQQYNRQLTVPGASYAVRQNNPQFIPNKIFEGTLERSMPPDIVGQRPAERLQELRRTFGEEAVDTGRGLAPEVETPVLRARDQLLRESALDKWVNTTLRKYISRDMATPKDPVREMAEQGVLAKAYEDNPGTRETARRRREDLGMAPEGLAQTEAARMWEDVADVSFRSTPADFFMDAGTEASFLADNPWIARLDPNTPITRAGTRMAGEPQDTFQHIVDVLKSDMEMGKIRPESLNKMSMADAVKRAHDYNLEKVKAAADARKAAMADRPVYRKYDGDYQWIQLTKPGDFANESDAMGHSVRGYEPVQGSPDWRESSGSGGFANYGVGGWEGIKSGKARVYSLRDASGDPHGTIEVMSTPNASPAKFRERGISYAEASDAAKRAIGVDPATEAQFIQTLSGEQRMRLQQSLGDALAKEFFTRTGEMPMENHILQIKGKGNEPLSPKYQKYAQDFVQKGNWDSVSDLGNAGLHQTPKGYMTSSEIIDLFQTLPDNVRNSGFVQERINNLKSNANPNYDYYDAYLYAKQTF
jgi:hypothetical protein